MFCLAVVAVFLGITGLFATRQALRVSNAFERWQYRGSPELEPSEAAVWVTRVASSALLVVVAMGGISACDYAQADSGCSSVISAWGEEPPGAQDLSDDEPFGAPYCDAIELIDGELGDPLVEKGPAPKGYTPIVDGEPDFLKYVTDLSQFPDKPDLLLGPVRNDECSAIVEESARTVRVWLTKGCEEDEGATLDDEGTFDGGPVALRLVAVKLDRPVGDRKVVGPGGKPVKRIDADVSSFKDLIGLG